MYQIVWLLAVKLIISGFLLASPAYGAAFGTEVFLRFSLLLLLASVVEELLPRICPLSMYLLSYLHLIIFGVFLWLPLNLTPCFVVWLYECLLQMSEPVLMVIEQIIIVHLVRKLSRWAVEMIEDDCGYTTAYQAGIFVFSFTCYGLFLRFSYAVFFTGSTLELGLLVAVMILSIVNLILVFYYEEGAAIISDASFVSFWSVLLLVVKLKQPAMLQSHESPRFPKNDSFIEITHAVVQMIFDRSKMTSDLFSQLISLQFLFFLIIRSCTVAFLITRAVCWFKKKEDDDETNLDLIEDDSLLIQVWKHSLLIKFIIIFSFTQLFTMHLYRIHGSSADNDLLHWLHSLWPAKLQPAQALQIGIINSWHLLKTLGYFQQE